MIFLNIRNNIRNYLMSQSLSSAFQENTTSADKVSQVSFNKQNSLLRRVVATNKKSNIIHDIKRKPYWLSHSQ